MGSHAAGITTFVGRRRELADLDELLGSQRLVSLCGSGGCGKTRLATRFAAQHGERWTDGAWFVDLAAAATEVDLARAIAQTLSVTETVDTDLRESIIGRLHDRHLLLVLDNCEQVIGAAAVVTEAIVQRCPEVTVLATSREPLAVPGETIYRVPSLNLVAERPAELSDAEQLFVDRASAIRPDFRLTAANAPAVAEICARLDGIPLAIELAAARVNVITAEQIAAALTDRFDVLGSGGRTVRSRQQTLVASIAWSYDLLGDRERVLLRRLSVFVAGFDLRGAEAVGGFEPLHRDDVLDVLARLVDRSLVTVVNAGMTSRYRMLETIRQFAGDHLAAAGEADLVRDRHLDRSLALTAHAVVLGETDQLAALDMVETDRENLYASLDWALASGRSAEACRLAGDLWGYWASQGRFAEGRVRADAVVGAADANTDPCAYATAVFALSWLEDLQGDYLASYEHAEKGLAIARAAGDRQLEGRFLARLGMSHAGFDYGSGTPSLEDAIAIARSAGDMIALTLCLAQLGWYVLLAEGPVAARGRLEEARGIAHGRNDLVNGAQAEVCLGLLESAAGDVARAEGFAETGRDLAARSRNVYMEAIGLWVKATISLSRGDLATAVSLGAAADAAVPLGRNFAWAASHVYRADLALARGDRAGALANARIGFEAAEVWGPWQADSWRVQALTTSARAHAQLGDLAAARHAIDDALELVSAGRAVLAADVALAVAAQLARADGRPDLAGGRAAEGLSISLRTGMFGAAADLLEVLAALASDSHDDVVAARYAGAAARHRERAGVAGRWAEPMASAIDPARERLGDEAFEVAFGEGFALSIEAAIDLATRGRDGRKRAAGGWSGLTRSELRVVELVTQGLSNPEIGKVLFISRRTVDAHLSHVHAKLGISSRAELAAEAARRER